jgi:hypothetical protein
MSKKHRNRRKRRREPLSHDSDRFGSYLDFDEDAFDLDQEAASRYEARFAGEEDFEEYEDDERPPFDFDRWRDDLIARNQNRQRMRQRDLKRGALRSFRVPEPVAPDDDSFDPDEDDDF